MNHRVTDFSGVSIQAENSLHAQKDLIIDDAELVWSPSGLRYCRTTRQAVFEVEALGDAVRRTMTGGVANHSTSWPSRRSA